MLITELVKPVMECYKNNTQNKHPTTNNLQSFIGLIKEMAYVVFSGNCRSSKLLLNGV